MTKAKDLIYILCVQGKITTFFGNDTINNIGGKFDQIAKKLELPEIIYPSDVRNDLYIVINSGKIFKEKEKIGNIEICLEVCDVKGNVIKGTIRSGISKNIFNMKKNKPSTPRIRPETHFDNGDHNRGSIQNQVNLMS